MREDEQPIYRATFERQDVLGHALGSGTIDGHAEFVLENLQTEVMRDMRPGDRLAVTVACDLPADHPLTGVDLSA